MSVLLYLRSVVQDDGAQDHVNDGAVIESTGEVPGASRALRARAKKHDGDYNRHRHNDARAYKPSASRARSPAREPLPSAGTSGNRVRKYSSVIPSLPHAKTLQLFNVIAQLRSSGGGFSVNWGVLGVRGKGASALEQRGDAPLSQRQARGPLRAVYWPRWRMSRQARAGPKSWRGKKNAPLWAHHPVCYSAFLTRGLATARLIDQCGLTALAVLTAPSLDRRLAGNPCA